MSFVEAQFPVCPSIGQISAPGYNVSIARVQSGREQRNQFWQYPLHSYNLTVGPRMESEIEQVLEVFHAVGGTEYGFRFSDGADYKSCALSGTPAATDQPLVAVPGSPSQYQLTKSYAFGSIMRYRRIQKPVSGSVLVAADGAVLTAGVDWTVDVTTGLVTFLTGADEGSPAPVLTWGGEFDVPVRFNNPELPILLDQAQIASVEFVLREIRI